MEKRIKIFIYVGIVLCCIAVLVAAIVLSLVKTPSSSSPVALTQCGNVEGKLFEEKQKGVYEFLNIPYAVPPTDQLRWRAPQPMNGSSCWNGTLYYNDNVIMCPQEHTTPQGKTKIIGTENCLILSVRTTSLAKDADLPVLVWIHGGGMIAGHSRSVGSYPDTEFTASMGFVTVSVNYRLGIFGFLSLQDLWENGEYGNFAIMDQILALRWIQTNIKNFGGNPKDVTIFGHSGGGTAAFCLLAASLNQSQNLFHKVIASSGVPNVHVTKEQASKEYEAKFLRKTKCASVQHKSTCLRGLSTEEVMASSPITWKSLIIGDYELSFPSNTVNKGIPLQIIDTTVVKFSPGNIVEQKLPSTYKMSILMGNMAQEPCHRKAPNLKNWSSWNALADYLKPRVSSFRNCSYIDLLTIYRNRTSQKFTPIVLSPYYAYSLLTADTLLSCATTRLAYKLAKRPSFKVFSYIVSQALTPSGAKVWYPEHNFDITPLFDFKMISKQLPEFVPSKSDLILKNKLREMVKNFISSDETFEKEHMSRTLEFWNATTQHTWSEPYHERECDFLQQYGFLKHSWGNRGIWDS